MDFDFSLFFDKYESLAAEVDTIFDNIQAEHPDCVSCGLGCSDCCYALFDLSLIEALYLNHRFNEAYSGAKRSIIMERADKADRQAYQIKMKMFKATQKGTPASEILAEVARMRIRCPLLGEDDKCDLYDARPITCRLYGIPTSITGESHTCGKSGFKEGVSYPTVHMDKIQDRLMLLSLELVRSLQTRHSQMADVLVPVSMALLNKYDEEYLGIVDEPQGESGSWTMHTDGSVTEEDSPCSSCASSGDCDASGPDECGIAPKMPK